MTVGDDAGRPERLIYMANQIATFFAAQRGEAPVSVADHLRAFWEPTMRAEILAWVGAGGGGLSPTAEAAVRLLSATGSGQVRAALAAEGKPTARRPGDDAG
jgi:formate dehydrogenase subunit delta